MRTVVLERVGRGPEMTEMHTKTEPLIEIGVVLLQGINSGFILALFCGFVSWHGQNGHVDFLEGDEFCQLSTGLINHLEDR